MLGSSGRVRWLSLVVAACLGFGSIDVALGQDSHGNIVIAQGNGSASNQGNDEGDGDGGQSQTQRQQENQSILGSLDQLNDASNERDYAQEQQGGSSQDNANDAVQANAGTVTDIGGDDNSPRADNESDHDETGVTGNGNLAADGDVIAALITILLLVFGAGNGG